jgi:hypothetical protein
MCFGKFARYWVGIADVMSVHEFALHSVFVRADLYGISPLRSGANRFERYLGTRIGLLPN